MDEKTLEPALGAAAGAEPAARSAELLELLRSGGPVVAILLALSVIACTVILVKLWQMRAAGLGERAALREALRHRGSGRLAQARELLAGRRGPAARALARVLAAPPPATAHQEERLREVALRAGSEAVEALRSHLRILEVIGSLAPLLGLLGTVLGMIEAFRELESAGMRVDPALLSGGIWEALLTTALGLVVAIPAVAAHAGFERHLERAEHDVEVLVSHALVEEPSGEARPQESAPAEPAAMREASGAARS